jgi:hypothetical protein
MISYFPSIFLLKIPNKELDYCYFLYFALICSINYCESLIVGAYDLILINIISASYLFLKSNPTEPTG